MGVLALSHERKHEHGLRPLNILHDLDDINQLIGTVFADDIPREGAQIQRDLVLLSMVSPLLWTLRRISTEIRDSFDGFVWIEDGRLVGNVTLSRDDPSRQVWSITNVAVHPDYRRRGIARSLMQAALEAIRERGGGSVWLEVRADNVAAYRLYESMGFRFVDGIVTYTHTGRLRWPLPQAGLARHVQPAEEHKLYALILATRSADSLILSPLRKEEYCRPMYRRLANQLRDLFWQERRFWLVVVEDQSFTAAAYVHLGSIGGNSARIYIHPQARGHVEETIIHGVLQNCSASGSSIIIQVSSIDEHARTLLRQYGLMEVRNLHRLMIDV